MTTDTLHSSISKMDHLDKKHNPYLYSPLTIHIYTHACRETHGNFLLAKEVLYNELEEREVLYEVAEESLKSTSK